MEKCLRGGNKPCGKQGGTAVIDRPFVIGNDGKGAFFVLPGSGWILFAVDFS